MTTPCPVLLVEDEKDDELLFPVVVFTSSNAPAEINRAYDLGANSFILKPVNYSALVEILALVHNYWRMVLRANTG